MLLPCRKAVGFGPGIRSAKFSTVAKQLSEILAVASIVRILSSNGGLHSLQKDADSISMSEDIVLQVLRRGSLDVSKKLAFFKWLSSRPSYKHTPQTYSQMLREVSFSRRPNNDLIELLALMKRDGLELDSWTLKLILNGLIRAHRFEYALDVLDYVEREMVSCLSPDAYSPVVIGLVRKNHVSTALSIFFKLLHASAATEGDAAAHAIPDPVVCNELLVGLKKAGKKDEFKQVFAKLRETKVYPSESWGYNICIHTLGSWGDLSTALGLFKEMKERGGSVYPDLCTYNSLIQVLCVLGKVNDALIVWNELKDSSGHDPDAFSYRIMIQGLCKSYRVNDAMKIFNEMQQHWGVETEAVTCNSLLDGLFKSRKLNEACKFFETMVEIGVQPSCTTYNVLIDGLYINGKSLAAYTLFSDLKSQGNKYIDEISFDIVISHLCREDRLEEALQLVEEMEPLGFRVDLVTVTTLLMALYKKGKEDWIERLMMHVRDGNLVPNVFRWKSTMECSLESPQSKHRDSNPMFPEASDVADILLHTKSIETRRDDSFQEKDDSGEIDEWSSSPYMDHLATHLSFKQQYTSHFFATTRGVRVTAAGDESFDIDMANTFLSIFLAKGELSLACKLFEIFSNVGVDPVSYTYNSIMSSFLKKGYLKQVWGVVQAMAESETETTHPGDIATYNLIIQGLGKMGRADLASCVLDKLEKDGGFIDIVMYNTLINALGKAGRVEKAEKLFQQMRASGINPDVVTYNTLIEVHSKAGHLKEARKFLKMMLDAKCAPNHVTDTILDCLKKEMEKKG